MSRRFDPGAKEYVQVNELALVVLHVCDWFGGDVRWVVGRKGVVLEMVAIEVLKFRDFDGCVLSLTRHMTVSLRQSFGGGSPLQHPDKVDMQVISNSHLSQ